MAALSIRTGLILPQDDIAEITSSAVQSLVEDGDIICVTEAVVARSQNRYVSVDELASQLKSDLSLKPGGSLAVISPIASRNRFALILQAIARATAGGKVIVHFPPAYDEVGNLVIQESFSSMRLRLKKIFRTLRDLREDTPYMNVLLREIIAALKLQELGFDILGIRKITGEGMPDITARDPAGRTLAIEVGSGDVDKIASKANKIMAECNAQGSLAVLVDLESEQIIIADGQGCADGSGKAVPQVESFSGDIPYYLDAEVIHSHEVHRRVFPHPITGIDYRLMYLDIIAREGAAGEILFTNNPLKVFDFGNLDGVVIGAVHQRKVLKDLFAAFGFRVPVITIQELGPPPWGVIGSNIADAEKGILKLLPEDADGASDRIAQKIKETSGKSVEVLIFGDGAYKDPDTGIFELADPHPCIGCSAGLREAKLRTGSKLKLQVETLYRQGYTREQINDIIQAKELELTKESLGTTPRSVTSILGSLADLAAGSADAATPIVLIRGFKL